MFRVALLFSAIQDFEEDDDLCFKSRLDIVTDRAGSMSRPRISKESENFLLRVQELAQKIWKWESKRDRVKPVLCDFVSEAELIFFLLGFGPDDDGERDNHACQVCLEPLNHFFSILWDDAQKKPFKNLFFCRDCVFKEKRRFNSETIQIIECKLSRWKLSKETPDTLPGYVKKYFDASITNAFSYMLNLACRGFRFGPVLCTYPNESFFNDLQQSVQSSVESLLTCGKLRKHLTFVDMSFAILFCPILECNDLSSVYPYFLQVILSSLSGLSSSNVSADSISMADVSPKLDRLLDQMTHCQGPGDIAYRSDGSKTIVNQTVIRERLPLDIEQAVISDIHTMYSAIPKELLTHLSFALFDDSDGQAYWRFAFGHWLAIRAASGLHKQRLQDCMTVQS